MLLCENQENHFRNSLFISSFTTSVSRMLNRIFEQLRTIVYRVNLFETGSTDERIIQHQRLTTRIYITLTFIILLFIGIVTLTLERSISAYIPSPPQNTFQQLFKVYPSTLQCPCYQIAIQYQSFTDVRFQFHQVCTSSFVSDHRIRSISVDENNLQMSFFWQIIAGLCQLSQSSIEMIIDQFAVTDLLTPTAIDSNLLRIQTQEAFDNLLSETRMVFFRNLVSIQRIITGNQLVSALDTNFEARWALVESQQQPTLIRHLVDGCSCLNLNGCPRPSMSGIVSDCLMMNGVLQSSLQCYYDAMCLAQLHPSTTILNPLISENNHQSKINSTIEDLLNRFLIDQLTIEIDFDRYYHACQPKYCSYSYRRRFDLLFTLTIMIGILSGLNVVLRFLSLFIAKKLFRRRLVTSNNQSIGTPSKC